MFAGECSGVVAGGSFSHLVKSQVNHIFCLSKSRQAFPPRFVSEQTRLNSQVYYKFIVLRYIYFEYSFFNLFSPNGIQITWVYTWKNMQCVCQSQILRAVDTRVIWHHVRWRNIKSNSCKGGGRSGWMGQTNIGLSPQFVSCVKPKVNVTSFYLHT